MSVPEDELKQILNQLNDENRAVAKGLLTWLLEKQSDEKDDILSLDNAEAIEEVQTDLERGNTKSSENVRRELKTTVEDQIDDYSIDDLLEAAGTLTPERGKELLMEIYRSRED